MNATIFDAPPTELHKDMIGWRYEAEHYTDDNGHDRWRPRAWTIVYPTHILEVDYATKLAMRDSVLHTPGRPGRKSG
jgi:hypothetical protein